MARTSERDEALKLVSRDPWLALVVALVEQARREARVGNAEARSWLDGVRDDMRDPACPRRAA